MRIKWSKTYGGVANSVVQINDGGYMLVGSTYSYGAGQADLWLVKTNPQGDEEWSKTYGGENLDVASSVDQTNDSGYAMVGYTESYGARGYFNFPEKSPLATKLAKDIKG
ncbi:hypothetical protein AKJ39_04515 [candidate division MSBL1 archaeon SCGC-AAA259J03]|uniref:Bulb-type lectin domain-containing protein n=1 Tax=candidate division MSBL1 archaeon SCGC-AAA259J03 TaxID=1698269 RepID=A0A656YUU0_9EURY|nr:hypothetical protein AKJ39_04515 [candidate division MSBL1 archaeon SCGC-AAA259J03]